MSYPEERPNQTKVYWGSQKMPRETTYQPVYTRELHERPRVTVNQPLYSMKLQERPRVTANQSA